MLAAGSLCILLSTAPAPAADLPDPAKIQTVELFNVPHYCEGVVFDAPGTATCRTAKSSPSSRSTAKTARWAETGAPNGHKILADGTHLVCDASQHAVLHLSADGKLLRHASDECDGKPLRGPNDLTLDTPNGGFYFSDPGADRVEEPDRHHSLRRLATAKTHLLVDDGLAFPNGIVLTPDGKKLYLAESQKNRVLVYDVLAPGKVGEPQSVRRPAHEERGRRARSTTSPTACASTRPATCTSPTTA